MAARITGSLVVVGVLGLFLLLSPFEHESKKRRSWRQRWRRSKKQFIGLGLLFIGMLIWLVVGSLAFREGHHAEGGNGQVTPVGESRRVDEAEPEDQPAHRVDLADPSTRANTAQENRTAEPAEPKPGPSDEPSNDGHPQI